MLRAVYNTLHRAEFAITGGYLVECGAEFQETYVESDGLTRHGVIRFRLLLDEATYAETYSVTESGDYLQTEAGYYLVID